MEQAWTVPDVYLLTDGHEGEVAVPHLTLTFVPTGIELDKPDGDAGAQLGPAGGIVTGERSSLPDGRNGVVILSWSVVAGAIASCSPPMTQCRPRRPSDPAPPNTGCERPPQTWDGTPLDGSLAAA